jgi:hypothetical protein
MTVPDTDRVSRFLLFSGWFAPTTGRVKPDAFIPPKDGQLSVSCTEGMEDKAVWPLGQEIIEARQSGTLYGRADFTAGILNKHGLRIDRDNVPLRHANISGYPMGDKAAMRQKAVDIAAEALLVLNLDENQSRPQRLA